jgi:hypothetical protein
MMAAKACARIKNMGDSVKERLLTKNLLKDVTRKGPDLDGRYQFPFLERVSSFSAASSRKLVHRSISVNKRTSSTCIVFFSSLRSSASSALNSATWAPKDLLLRLRKHVRRSVNQHLMLCGMNFTMYYR